jgi:hypothetical protein
MVSSTQLGSWWPAAALDGVVQQVSDDGDQVFAGDPQARDGGAGEAELGVPLLGQRVLVQQKRGDYVVGGFVEHLAAQFLRDRGVAGAKAYRLVILAGLDEPDDNLQPAGEFV